MLAEDDALYGDFEDMEMGETYQRAGKEGVEGEGKGEEEEEEGKKRLEKKKRLKTAFDVGYDEGGRGGGGNRRRRRRWGLLLGGPQA